MENRLVEWIKRELLVRELSQRQVAKRSGMSHAYLSDVLRGEKDITCNFCFSVAKGLNEPVWNILMMSELIDDVPTDLMESEEIRVLVRKYNNLALDGRKDVLKYIDFVALKEHR